MPVDAPARRPVSRAGRRLPRREHGAAQLPAHPRPAGRRRATSKAPLPAYSPVVNVAGLTFRVAKLPALRLAEPASMVVNVSDAQGRPVDVHAVLRRARARDLLPRRHARLLPFAHLRQRSGLQRGLRHTGDDRSQHEARAHGARRAAARDRSLAAVPPGHPPRQAHHGAVYAEGCDETPRACRGTPPRTRARGPGRPRAGLRRDADAAVGQLGGPRLPVIAFVSLALRRCCSRSACCGSPRWACASATRCSAARARRRGSRWRASASTAGLLALARWPGSPRSRPGSTRAWACTCAGGSASRGPVHRNAIPDPARPLARGRRAPWRRCATSLAWARRVVASLRRLLQPRAVRRPHPLAARQAAAPPGSWPALCVRAARPSSPFRSHRHERRDMNRTRVCRAFARAGVLVAVLALAPSAFAHAHLYPDEMPSDHGSAAAAGRAERGGERLHDPDHDDRTERVRARERLSRRRLDDHGERRTR